MEKNEPASAATVKSGETEPEQVGARIPKAASKAAAPASAASAPENPPAKRKGFTEEMMEEFGFGT